MKFSHLLLVGLLMTGGLSMTPLLADEASDKKMTEYQYETIKYRAKALNDSLAQALLGACYVQGMYGQEHVDNGLDWLKKSARQDNVFALKALINFYKDDSEKHSYWKARLAAAPQVDPTTLEPDKEELYYRVENLITRYDRNEMEDVIKVINPYYGHKRKHVGRAEMVKEEPVYRDTSNDWKIPKTPVSERGKN